MKDFKGSSFRGFEKGNLENEVDEARLKKILSGDARELNDYANELSQRYLSGKESEKLSTSQIRSVLDEIQRMREFDETRLQLLRPKLAYAAGRHGGKVRDFQRLVDTAIRMTNAQNYKFFKCFVEAIVAYHRYHGGK
ncbi:MAG: type III-A CRISPR-associated protein Csm2 [Deltaproteobacteria bacterium]|nr:type III-A CRISPR-associated protein Csm2 [Deltaproteobacteria bacterium]